LRPGTPYSTTRLDAARSAALGLGVFSSVEVEPVLTNPNSSEVPVVVRVEPSQLRSVKVGGGVELDVIRTDIHGTTGWEDRNFLGGLRRFSIDLKPGIVLFPTKLPEMKPPEKLLPENRIHLELRQPGFIEPRTEGILTGGFDIYPVPAPPGAESGQDAVILGYRQLQSSVGLARNLGRLYSILSYNFLLSFPFDYGSTGIDPLVKNKVVVHSVDLTNTLDFRDDPIRPHKGIFLRNSVQVGFGPLSGDPTGPPAGSFWDIKEQPEIRGYIPVSRSVTLALRATAGFLFPHNYAGTLVNQTPAERDVQLIYFRGFFSGGANSNRGYAYHGVGPRGTIPFLTPALYQQQQQNNCAADPTSDACGFPYGGLTLWEASAEVRFPLSGALTGITFCDASDVSRVSLSNQTSQDRALRFDRPHLACGVGLHYDTPVGPLRLDFGYQIPGLQAPEGDRDPPVPPPWAIHIGIGEAF
jgi:outer membrane protein assembly factor BamA